MAWMVSRLSGSSTTRIGLYSAIRDVGVAGCEGVHVGKDKGFGAVVAELGLVVALDDGEGGEDVGGVVPVEAVEVEVEGVEAGAEVAAEALELGDGEGFEVGAGLGSGAGLGLGVGE